MFPVTKHAIGSLVQYNSDMTAESKNCLQQGSEPSGFMEMELLVCVNSWTELRRAVSSVAVWAVRGVASMPSVIVCRFMLVREMNARAGRKN